MLNKEDRVVYEGVSTICLTDEFCLFGEGVPVIELEGFEGWINAKLPQKMTTGEFIKEIRKYHQMEIYTVNEDWCIHLFPLDVCANDYDVQPCQKFACIYEDGGTDLNRVLENALEWAQDQVSH